MCMWRENSRKSQAVVAPSWHNANVVVPSWETANWITKHVFQCRNYYGNNLVHLCNESMILDRKNRTNCGFASRSILDFCSIVLRRYHSHISIDKLLYHQMDGIYSLDMCANKFTRDSIDHHEALHTLTIVKLGEYAFCYQSNQDVASIWDPTSSIEPISTHYIAMWSVVKDFLKLYQTTGKIDLILFRIILGESCGQSYCPMKDNKSQKLKQQYDHYFKATFANFEQNHIPSVFTNYFQYCNDDIFQNEEKRSFLRLSIEFQPLSFQDHSLLQIFSKMSIAEQMGIMINNASLFYEKEPVILRSHYNLSSTSTAKNCETCMWLIAGKSITGKKLEKLPWTKTHARHFLFRLFSFFFSTTTKNTK